MSESACWAAFHAECEIKITRFNFQFLLRVATDSSFNESQPNIKEE